MKISLAPEAYKTLYNVCQEIQTTAGELVSLLVMDYAKNKNRDEPEHKCGFCSRRYFSSENLEWHIKRKHSQQTVIKR